MPEPSTFHGFDIGENYVITSAIYDYYRSLAAASPRVEYEEYGRSIQGRPFPILFISSEENLARKEEIRKAVHRLTDVTEPTPDAELQQRVVDLPAIVWALIVDTDEEAGVNVLQELAWELATREDAEARSLRENLLIVLTPLTNPDSHARYVAWHMIYNVEGAATDPLAVENEADWAMNTDGNAWGVDVNRDFGWFVTPEIASLGRVITEWHPQIVADVHSGPNVIFIPPFGDPGDPMWSPIGRTWRDRVAQEADTYFGLRGWSFYSRAYEGLATPSVSRAWTALTPAVATFLFESFGGRPGKTTAFRRDDGTLATMRMAMDRHKGALYSVMNVARDRRQELLRDAQRVVLEAVEKARSNPIRTVIFPAEGPAIDPEKVRRLVDRLALQGIEVRQTQSPVRTRARSFFAMDTEREESFPAGSYVVDLVQPKARVARRLLDPTIDFENPTVNIPFTGSMPYSDVTWGNLPLLFGVPAYALGRELAISGAPVEYGRPLRSTPLVETLAREEPPYAYVLPAETEANVRVATALLEEGYRLRVFQGSFRLEDVDYPKGTLTALAQRNPASLHERIHELVQEHGAHLVEADGPYTDQGPTFGDEDRVTAVPAPRVAVLADWPVAHDHVYGGIRSVLEGDFSFPFSPLKLEKLNSADLSDYTVVVLPHAGMSMRNGANFSRGYRGRLDMANLRRYVQGGGTLVAVKGAAEVLAQDSVLGPDVNFDGWARRTNGAILRAEWIVPVPGAVRNTEWRPGLDRVGIPLIGAGYPEGEFAAPGAYPVLLSVKDSGAAEVVARYGEDPSRLVLEGFVLDSDRDRVAGHSYIVVQPVGSGRVIYFADSTTFRGHWYGLNRLFLNTLILGPTL